MKMHEIVVREAIVAQLEANARDEVLEELLAALSKAGAIDAGLSKPLLASMLERERRGSTGFGKGVAVPHVKHEKVEKMVAAIGVSQSGVEFNALDKQPVYSVVMLISPAGRPEEHLQAMESIFKNLSSEQFRRFLRQSQTSEDIWALLQEADAGGGRS